MNGLARKGLVCAVVAGGVLASAGYAQADSAASGDATGSPGILSGNSVQVPVHVPANVCGNTVDAAALLDPAFGNDCANTTAAPPVHTPVPAPPAEHTPAPVELAHTGAGGAGATAAGGALLLLGGTVLYRRTRPAAGR
ncbi:chaplin [Streptomyces sp. NPDC020983]|uniref:chaplin n=1 Tax=Streptomyces sp. NPDC020983 TaxID=3365106 RepID=UPI0037B62A7C